MSLPRINNENLQNDIHIWVVDLDVWNLSCLEAVQELSESEAKKAGRFHFKIHQNRYVKGRFMLRSVLGMYLDSDFYDQEFHANRHGKPALQKHPEDHSIRFNISNSENICVCAFSQNSEIGIDIEKIHDLPNMDQIIAASFTDKERRKFHSLSEPDLTRTFFQYWARKEALLKAMGMGMSYPLNKIDIAGNENSPQLVTKIEGSDISNQWTILDMDICKGFAAALALQGEHRDLAGHVRIFHPADENMIRFRSRHNNSFPCGAEI
jgi:4'-phosphopantetheinyl transferase